MMTKLIEKDDPQWFAQTSDIPYDRHHYKIVCQNKSFVVESGMSSRMVVEQLSFTFFEGTVIEVIDKPKPKSKGFK